MIPALLAAAVASAGVGRATLHVGVHRDAGTLAHVAADGASGQCAMLGTSRLVCPADGPVRFRWGGGGAWALTGDLEVGPGEVGVAFVLAADDARGAEVARLRSEPGPSAVRELFVDDGDGTPPAPSRAMLDALFARLDDADMRVRREVARAMMPFVRRSSADPFPPDAPAVLPPGALARLAADPERRVRLRAAALIREVGPEDPAREDARAAVVALSGDGDPAVRRAAVTASTAMAVGSEEALAAWRSALGRVPDPGPVGRAACNGLARLRQELDSTDVDAEGALALVLAHHPERAWRVWAAWRDAVPFDAGRAEQLLRQTAGLSEALLRAWAEREPAGLAEVVARWEPGEPHSQRFRVVAAWLGPRTTHPALREALGLGSDDRLSDDPGGPPPE